MPRSLRQNSESGFHHVIARGNNRQRVFRGSSDFLAYRSLLDRFGREHGVRIHHYCLMGNHVHFILGVDDAGYLSRFMRDVQRGYVLFLRKRDGQSGHLWQGRYKNFPIEKEDYLLECARYIERNPVQAGIVKSPADYPWSSYSYYAVGKADSLITPSPFYVTFGGKVSQRQKAYREYVNATYNYE